MPSEEHSANTTTKRIRGDNINDVGANYIAITKAVKQKTNNSSKKIKFFIIHLILLNKNYISK